MKKLKFSMAFLLCMSATQILLSQEKSEFKLGVLGGINFSSIDANNSSSKKALTGVNFGIFAKLPITNSFAIQPEIYFTTKGAELTYQNVFVDGTAKFNLNYVEVPFLAVFKIVPGFNFQLGPYASYLMSSNVKNVSDLNFNFETNIDSGEFRKFDTGIAAGLGFEGKSLGIGVRYNLGLITVGKEKTYLGTNYIFPNGKNSVLNVYLSYSIF
jgi:Outer membrane protein beta-barrel domain